MIIALFKSWFQKPREPTQHEKFSQLIHYLKTQDFEFVYSSDLSMFRLTVVKQTIFDYLNYLRKINYQLSTEEEIYPRSVNLKTFNILLPIWFIQEGNFIKPSEQMLLLLDEADMFLNHYVKYDSIINRSYTQDHNLRMIGGVYGDLYTLLKEMQDVSNKSIYTGSQQTDKNR